MVPDFDNTESMQIFLDELEPDEEVEQDVIDPETGEVFLYAGESPMDSEWFVPEEKEPEAEEVDESEYDWDAYEQEMLDLREEQYEFDEKMKEEIREEATAGGKDWAADTLSQARANPSMWKDGSSYQQWDSPEDYVLGFGQDAAGDVAQSLEYTLHSNEGFDWYRSLPTQEPSYHSSDAGRPTKQSMKDFYADYFYDGVSQAVKEAKEEAA